MNFVSSLPVGVVANVLLEWLDLNFLASLDNACCSTKHRPALLSTFASLRLHGPLKLDHIAQDGLLVWLNRRSIRVESVLIWGDADLEVFIDEYAARSGRSVKSVTFFPLVSVEREMQLVSTLCLHCRSLESLVTTFPLCAEALVALGLACAHLRTLRSAEPWQGAVRTWYSSAPTISAPSLHKTEVLHRLSNAFKGTVRLCCRRWVNVNNNPTNFNVEMITRFAQLSTLSLRGSAVGDTGMLQIVTTSVRIEHLDVFHCTHLSIDGLLAIARNLPQLQSLNVQGTVANDAFLRELALARANTLKALYVAENYLVSERGVRDVTRLCTGLAVLSIDASIISYSVYYGSAFIFGRVTTLLLRAQTCCAMLLTMVGLRCKTLQRLRIDTDDIACSEAFLRQFVARGQNLQSVVIVSKKNSIHWVCECSLPGLEVSTASDLLCYHVLDNPLCTF